MGPPHWGRTKDRLSCWQRGGLLALSAELRGAEQLEAKRQESGAAAIGQEAEVTDAHEAFGKQVQEEAAQELIER